MSIAKIKNNFLIGIQLEIKLLDIAFQLILLDFISTVNKQNLFFQKLQILVYLKKIPKKIFTFKKKNKTVSSNP